MKIEDVLAGVSQILTAKAGRTGKVMTEAELPAPIAATPGTSETIPYPFSDTANPSPMMLVWPATRNLDDTERVLLSLFLDAFAGDESTTLYKKLIDSK